MKHKKKICPEYFEKIADGSKTFELRLADWKCEEGDILVLQEWNPKTQKYTGRKIEKKATYVAETKDMKFWSKKEVEKFGYQIIAFK